MAVGVNTIDPNTGVEIIRNSYHDNTTVIDGARYTTKEDPNELTQDDFLELMLQEMKMQDPTKPMDSASLMDSQLKMSTIESNTAMAASISSLQQSFASSALSTAANMIGHIVEDGTTNDKGEVKSYQVENVENKDGELYVNAKELTGIKDALVNAETETLTIYDADGYIYEDGTKLDYRVALDADGRFTYNDDGSLKIVDTDNQVVEDEAITKKYVYYASSAVYSEESTIIPLGSILVVN